MFYLVYYLWLGVTGFWDLLTFQSLTANILIDRAFSFAAILSILLIILMGIKPKKWNIAAAFFLNIAAVASVCFLFAARSERSSLAAAGYITALIQLLVIFVVLLLIALTVCLYTSKRSKEPSPAPTEETPEN